MMLTRSTAKTLGVKNRLDPEQSIKGGARHLNQMRKYVSKDVLEEDRMKFALAAYNIGLGHIEDAQKLTKKMGLNQNVWNDLKKVLPLLSQKRYYKTLKHGYARGSEPVKYVDSIYDYKDILQNTKEDLYQNK
jgi:membrane-bound lytic murein transglycosylase F